MKKLLSFVLLVSGFLLADNIPTKDVHVVLKDNLPDFCENMEELRSELKSDTLLSKASLTIMVFALMAGELEKLGLEDKKDPEIKCNFSVGSNGLLIDLYFKTQLEIETDVMSSLGYRGKERLTREGFDKLVEKTLEFSDYYSSCSVQTKPVIVSEKENRFAEDLKINCKTKMSLNDSKSFYQRYHLAKVS